MKLRSVAALIVTIAALSALYLISSTDLVIKERETQVYSISVIVPDENDDCWGNFKKGMDKAAIECNADISFITLYQRGRAGQQSELMRREVGNGAHALVVCPADSGVITENLEKSNLSIPVIALHSNISASQIKAYIGTNRRDMGESLASAVRRDVFIHGITEIVAVSIPEKREDIDETFDGFASALDGSGITVRREYASDAEDAARLLSENPQESGRAIVALDTLTTHTLALQTRVSSEDSHAVYGVGGTNTIIRGLEEGEIRAVCVANEYDAGYLSVKTAVELLDRSEKPGTGRLVASSLITPDSIYSKENEMLIFPIT